MFRSRGIHFLVQNLQGTEDIKKFIQTLAKKSAEERHLSVQEVMHYIISLTLVSSSFTVVNLSMDGFVNGSPKRMIMLKLNPQL